MSPSMYLCTVCNKRHRTGKIYQDHLLFKEKKENPNKEVLLIKLAKINRKIDFGNYDRDGKEFLETLRLKIERKLK